MGDLFYVLLMSEMSLTSCFSRTFVWYLIYRYLLLLTVVRMIRVNIINASDCTAMFINWFVIQWALQRKAAVSQTGRTGTRGTQSLLSRHLYLKLIALGKNIPIKDRQSTVMLRDDSTLMGSLVQYYSGWEEPLPMDPSKDPGPEMYITSV